MKSDIKNVAAFLAVAIWADGVYAEEEKNDSRRNCRGVECRGV